MRDLPPVFKSIQASGGGVISPVDMSMKLSQWEKTYVSPLKASLVSQVSYIFKLS